MASANVALHAGPGMGKTYLLRKLAAKLTERPAAPIVIQLDLSTVTTGGEAFREMLVPLLETRGVRQSTGDVVDLRESWTRLRSELRGSPRLVVLLIDEFDAVVRLHDGAVFIRYLREILHKSGELGCAAVLASRRPVAIIEEEIRGISTLASVCYPLYLRVVQDADLCDDWPEVKLLDESGRREVMKYSGGFPLLIRCFLAQVSSGLVSSEGYGETLEAHLYQTVEMQLDYLSRIGLGSTMAQEVLGPVVNSRPRDRRLLASLGVLASNHVSGYERGMADLDAFTIVLRHRTMDLSPWGIFGEVERATRSLVDCVMSEAFGVSWAEEVKARKASLRNVVEAAEQVRRDDWRKHGQDIPWLAYTYPKDLWEIMSNYWDRFSPCFPRGDRNYWRERFLGLGSLRNPLAHNRQEVITESQLVQVQVWSDEILRSVSHRLELSHPTAV
ncbi:AAA family ATPase [Geodermatophilus sp. SYSU D00779]